MASIALGNWRHDIPLIIQAAGGDPADETKRHVDAAGVLHVSDAGVTQASLEAAAAGYATLPGRLAVLRAQVRIERNRRINEALWYVERHVQQRELVVCWGWRAWARRSMWWCWGIYRRCGIWGWGLMPVRRGGRFGLGFD